MNRGIAAGLALCLAACMTGPQAAPPESADASRPAPIPSAMPDPLEPVNRGIGLVNTGLICAVLHPAGRAYRTVAPQPVRASIRNFGRNLTYPGRVVNLALQKRWDEAGSESKRFLTNTTAGVAGFFDPATKWDIPKADADFAQTFKGWGWEPGFYLMLPFAGPSDPPSAAGLASDSALLPWSYMPTPYRYGWAGVALNGLSDQTPAMVRLIRSEGDPYVTAKLLWTQNTRAKEADWTPVGPPDQACIDTLASVTNRTHDPAFADKAKRRRVKIPATGRELPYLVWMQKKNAPMAHLVPGIGSSAYANTAVAAAEQLYQAGFSVAITPSVFHPQFISAALTSAVPGYPASDCGDLHRAITAIDRQLEKEFPGRLGARALCGLSLGGFQTLYLAATETRHDPELLRFERYIALNTPVNLLEGLDRIDAYHAVADAWPAALREQRVSNIFAKGVHILRHGAPPEGVVPFSRDETKYMIGLSFRLLLRDAIYTSQERCNLGVLKTPLNSWKREPAYLEIEGYSFHDYIECFVRPYYDNQGVKKRDFEREASLRSLSKALAAQPKARAIANANDFVLNGGDLAWMRRTLGFKRLTVMPNGGHLGNLTSPEVGSALRKMTADLVTP